MPGWSLTLSVDMQSPFLDEAARRQRAAYMWTAGLGIAAIVALAVIVAGYVARQARLTRLKNDLIATVSHELKTPLASMRVLVDTLLAGRAEGERQATEYLELISRENERLSRLIDNFLTFSRMERNKRAFERERVDVGEAVRSAAGSVEERFTAPDCRLGVKIADDVSAVEGDRDALITVVLNLLDNAHKYTGESKDVTVTVRADGGSTCVSVADNGIGMTRRQARRVFDRFYQADQRLSRSAAGCGLGLSIVKFIVDAHGGSIDVDSRPGEGSTFTVRLPAAAMGEA
jgi:signal transduction histidine kinase